MNGVRHVPALDGLRGIAILIVMIYHETVIVGPTLVDRFVGFWTLGGWVGVDLFFVLSGFLITGILLDAKGGEGYFRNFYARRVLRIFPLYYAFVAFSLLVLPHVQHPKLQALARISSDDAWYWLYLSNVLIGINHEFRGFVDISWSLAIEEQFYIVWPLLVFLLSRRSLMGLCGAVVLGAIFWRVALLLTGADPIAVYVLTPGRADSLATGAFIACASRSADSVAYLRRAARPLALVTGSIFLLYAIVHGGFDEYAFPVQAIGYTLLALFFGAALSWTALAPSGSRIRQMMEWAPLRFFGKYSYALYLAHLPVRAVLGDAVFGPAQFPTLAGSPLPGLLLFYVFSSAVNVAIAWLSWHVYERHFLGLKRFFVTHARPVPAAAIPQLDLPVAR